ncbi:MAG: hypothetical protein ACM34A_12010 [Bacillota bacterium]
MSTTTELKQAFDKWMHDRLFSTPPKSVTPFDAYCAGRTAAHGEPSKVSNRTDANFSTVRFDSQAGSAEQVVAKAPVGEREEDLYVINRLATILADVAIALKGPELPLHRHGYHDLAEKAQVLVLERDLLRHQVEELRAALQHTAPAPSKAGEWTDEQKDILRRAAEILEHDCGRPHNAKELLALLSSAPAQAGSADSERAFYKAWDAYTQAPTYDMHRKDDFAAFEYAWKAALSAQGQQSEDARDAARYRWLTEHAYIKRCLTERGEIFLVGNVERKVPVDDSYPSVSAAIDAAMSTTPSEKDGGKE